MSPPLPANETRRLQALHATALLDTPPEAAFDDLTRLAAQLCSAPFACLSLIDENRQWFKAVCGLAVELTPRSQSFCTHALSRTSPLVVPDATRDSRFANLPAVTSPPYIRAYAGAPLVLEADLVLGTLCVLDTQPRTFTEEQLENLQRLARQVVDQIQLRSKISALHQSEERYRAMFEQTAVGIAQVGLKGQWLHVNPRLCEMLGYSESELLALTVQDITVPEDMVRDLELTTQLVAGEINSFTLHQRYIHKLGHWVWTNLAVCLVKHDDGSPFCFGSIIEDITAQKRAELSLAAQEIRIRKLSESLPFIVWTARPDGQVDYANQHLLDYTGLSADDDPATRWQAMVHPDDLATCLTSWQAALQSSSSLEIEYRLRRHADGSYRWFRVQAAPIHDEQGNIVLWYGTALDLHENRQLQAEASHLVHRLTTTLESITDAFYTLDPDWRFTYINHEAERLLRRDRSGLLGRTVWDEFPGFDTTRIAAEYRRALQNNLTIALEEFYSPLETWFEIRAYPSAEGLAVYFRDVTERRRQLNAVRESEERFQLIARATNEAIWDWDIRTGRLWWSKGFNSLFGLDPQTFTPTFDLWLDHVHPDDRESSGARSHSARASKTETYLMEYRFRRANGSYAHVEDHCYIIRDEDGQPIRMVGSMNDVTPARLAAQKLAEQAALLDKAQDAILVRDLDHRILYWNRSAERLYGWTSTETLGRSVKELLYGDPTTFNEATATTVAHGEWVGEITQSTKSGALITVEGRWTLVRDELGQPKSILAINTDITERKKLESQFLRAQRMESIGTLAGGIAHDLNNLLSPIVMGVDLLRQMESNPKLISIIDNIGKSAKRGTDLVKQVLSFARGVDGARVALHLDHVVREIESIIHNTFPKNIRFEHETVRDLRLVIGDPTQLHQVLLNLCVNARDAMPDGGCIRITTANTELDQTYSVLNRGVSSGRYVVLNISDEGCGIPTEIIDRVFEPFFTTKEQGKGTGLGLSTSLGIIRSHGGFINVYSEKGKGSVFKIYLPAQAESVESPPVLANPDNFPRGNGECILVVDDETSILQITKQTLEAFGYRVLTAEDGAQAVALYATQREAIALVLTDMMMPIMDGPTLIAALRRIHPSLRIIAASGLNANGNVAKAANVGVKHFLPKPYSADRLLNLIRTALNSSE